MPCFCYAHLSHALSQFHIASNFVPVKKASGLRLASQYGIGALLLAFYTGKECITGLTIPR